MKPKGPLMKEHRLIEKMLDIIDREIKNINETKKIDTVFIDTAVDFIRFYADRTHHGKEEDILFKELENKKLLDKDKKMMNELIEEHKSARLVVKQLKNLNLSYFHGELYEINEIISKLKWLIDFYPVHIKKEDDVFFPETEKYFTPAELDDMLDKFWDFDKNMIHEKYKLLVEELKLKYEE